MFRFDAKPSRRRGAKTFELRLRVPAEVRARLGIRGTHWTRSLGTRDHREAMRRAEPKLRELERLANLAPAELGVEPGPADDEDFRYNPSLPKPSLEQVCRLYRDWSLQNEWEFREETTKKFLKDPGALLRKELLPLPPEEEIARIKDNPFEILVAAYRQRIQRALHRSRMSAVAHDTHEHAWFIAHLSEDMNYESIEPDARLLAALARADIQILEEMLNNDAAVLEHGTKSQTNVIVDPTPALSHVANDYFQASAGLSAAYATAIKTTLRDLIEVVGDKAVTTYGKQDAVAFKEVLLTLPANWRKKKVLRELGILQATQKAKELCLQRQRAKTIKEKWFHLSTIFEYARHNHDGVTNVFHAKSLRVSDGVAANEQCLPFSIEELAVLLASKLQGHLYWLTWLGLFTGARLNELCQLTKKHIKRHGDIHYIHFSRELQLKTGETESCVRAVPLHSTLIGLGFLKFVDSSAGPLFPGLKENDTTGRLSGAPSKRFSYHLEKIGIKKPRLSYQSLRHTFIGRLKTVAPRDAETRERLVGHAVAGVAGRYGNSYEAEAEDMDLLVERAKVIELVRFEFIDTPRPASLEDRRTADHPVAMA